MRTTTLRMLTILGAVIGAATLTGCLEDEQPPPQRPAPAVDLTSVPSLEGVWRSPDSGVTLVLEQEGGRLTGHFDGKDGDQTWRCEGSVDEMAMVKMIRWIPRSELGGTPEPAFSEVVARYGDEENPSFLRGSVTLRYDREQNHLKGSYGRIHVSYYSGSGEFVSAEEQHEDLLLYRVTNAPDLQVGEVEVVDERTNVDSPMGLIRPEGNWRVKATIRNAGVTGTLSTIQIALEKSEGRTDGEQQFTAFASPASLGRLAAGGEEVVEWLVPAADLSEEGVQIRITADSTDLVSEMIETNNRKRLAKLEAPPCPHVVWAEMPEGPAGSESATEPDYLRVLKEHDDQTQAVLCYIKMESQRRASAYEGSMAGAGFPSRLANNFLREYFASRSATTGQAAIDKISKHRGFPTVSSRLGAKLFVPAGMRSRYPELPEWLLPATHAYVGGDNAPLLELIDGPFLIGDDNRATGIDADVRGGGRNQSNTMHWATGVKYSYLPADGLREMFLGYELWHLEGWDVFGEDALNDLIAEEQGRLLGIRLRNGSITSRADLVRKMDMDFREARAWVGAMLKLRQDQLDGLIRDTASPKANIWWGQNASYPPSVTPPWSARSISQHLGSGQTLEQVIGSKTVERLVQVYTLIYETEEWEQRTGRRVNLTSVMQATVMGRYDRQFAGASKAYDAQWVWNPGR